MPDVQAHRSVRDTDRDSGLSGKERRNLRRSGTPVLSMKGTTEMSPSPAITSISASAFTCSSSSSSSSRNSNNGSGINSMGGRNGPRPGSKTVSVSSSTSISDQQILEKKRKQPSSSTSSSAGLATGMFLNDVTSANSITDVDKRMGTTATKSSGSINKKQRR